MTKEPPRFLKLANTLMTALLERGVKFGANMLLPLPGTRAASRARLRSRSWHALVSDCSPLAIWQRQLGAQSARG